MPSSPLRKKLRADGHTLKPLVRIGTHGVSDAVVEQIRGALAAHELIKIAVSADAPEERFVIANQLAERGIQIVQLLGRTILAYQAPSKSKVRKLAAPSDQSASKKRRRPWPGAGSPAERDVGGRPRAPAPPSAHDRGSARGRSPFERPRGDGSERAAGARPERAAGARSQRGRTSGEWTRPGVDRTREAPHGDRARSAPHGDRARSAPHGDRPRSAPHGDRARSAPHGDRPRGAPGDRARPAAKGAASGRDGERGWVSERGRPAGQRGRPTGERGRRSAPVRRTNKPK